MTASKPTEITYLKAFGTFWLLSTICGFIAGLFGGAILGAVLGASGVDIPTIQTFGAVLGIVISVPVSYGCFRWSVLKFIVPTGPRAEDPL